LFGEHQDYLGLDVIAAAINLYFTITAKPRKDNIYNIKMPDINEELRFVPSENILYESSRDYLKSAINNLKREYNFDFKQGYDFTLKSEIPINAGASSSSVMLVAWIKLLLKLFEHPDAEDYEKIAYLAYKSEVLEFNESGGMMDHYTASLGGMIHIETKYNPVKWHRINSNIKGIVLGNSLQPKDTVGVLKNLKSDVLKSVEMLKEYVPDFTFEKYSIDDVKKEIKNIPVELQRKLKANIIDYRLTQEALKMFNSNLDEKLFGELLNEHHKQLRDGLGISTPKIEAMLKACRKAGALGGKINGSGGGGTMFVYAPEKETEVSKAIDETGGKPYIVSIVSNYI